MQGSLFLYFGAHRGIVLLRLKETIGKRLKWPIVVGLCVIALLALDSLAAGLNGGLKHTGTFGTLHDQLLRFGNLVYLRPTKQII